MKSSAYCGRIVSLAPSITETLFALDAGDRVVGRTEHCDWPEEAVSVPAIGGFNTCDIKSILSLSPDIVLGTSLHTAILAQIRKSGISAAMLPAYPAYAAPDAIRGIGNAVNVVAQSKVVAQQVESAITRVEQYALSLAPKRVCYLCNIGCPAWFSCSVADSVEFINCTLVGRGRPPTSDRDEILSRILEEVPEAILIPECRKCRKECVESIFTANKQFVEYMALHKPRVTIISSKLLGRAGPRAALALNDLGRAIFGDAWRTEDI